MKSKTAKWIIIAAVAAAIAAVTTIVVLALRARARKKAWYEEEADFDYNLDDDFIVEDTEDIVLDSVEE